MERSKAQYRAVFRPRDHTRVLVDSSTDPLRDSRLAAAPISWGVCEVPGWGFQLAPDQVLSEMAALGFRATESGPVGYLGSDPDSVGASLSRHGLRLVGGFLPVVLHDRARHDESVASARTTGSLLAAVGGSFLISAVVVDLVWSPRIPLSQAEWRAVYDGLARLDDVAQELHLTHVVHPHWGTLVENGDDVARVLDGSGSRLCLDTGHLVLGGMDPVSVAGDAGRRIAHVHVKDISGRIADRLRNGELTLVEAVQAGLFRPLGDGDAPIAGTVEMLERSGYTGWYVLEQDCALSTAEVSGEHGPTEDVRRSIAFIGSVLGADRESHVKEGVST
jgi:inosose dehydratase